MTSIVLRPDATVGSLTDLTVTGGATAHAVLSDDSDSTYVQVNDAGGGFATLALETVALPAGAVVKTLNGRMRVGNVAGTAFFTVRDPDGALFSGSSATSAGIININSAISNFSLTQTTQAQVDGLEMFVYGDTLNQRIYDLRLTFTYVVKPATTVTAVSPDPYTASNLVPVAWTNVLDGSGGGQVRYEVKVFTDAQYGAGGFDPDTSTPYWESGERNSSALSATTGALASGDTYRAYVRVAQYVNALTHWGDWAFDTFDVTVSTADVDTVTAGASDAGAYIEVTVERDAVSEAWNFVEVERSVDNGTTWAAVRGGTYVDATGDADTFTVLDYETGNSEAVLYRARATRILSDLPITGEWTESTVSASWSSTSCVLKAPLDSSLNTWFVMGARNTYNTTRRAGVFSVLGARNPIVVSDVLSTHSGVLTIETYDDAEADALDAILEGASTVLVQYPPSMDIDDFYGSVTDVESRFVSANADNLWRVWTVSYVSVSAPADATASAP